MKTEAKRLKVMVTVLMELPEEMANTLLNSTITAREVAQRSFDSNSILHGFPTGYIAALDAEVVLIEEDDK